MTLFIDQLQAYAPCYISLKDDGALQRCVCCKDKVEAKDAYYIILPNKRNEINCKDCIDSNWLAKAKNLSHLKV